MSLPSSFRRPALAFIFLCLVPISQARAALEDSSPQDISSAERRGAELLLLYFQEGAEAWWSELATDSPYRELGPEAAAAELRVRLGPQTGSHWRLQTLGAVHSSDASNRAVFSVQMPSGLDDTFELRFSQEAGALKLHDLRSSVEPRPLTGSIGELLTGAAGSGPPGRLDPTPPLLLLWLLGLYGVVGLCGILGLTGRPGSTATPVVGALALVLIVHTSCAPSPEVPTENEGSGELPTLERLAPLEGLRNAIAGTAGVDHEQLEALVPPQVSDGARQAARIWRAQALLGQGFLPPAEKILAAAPTPSPRPLTELLRARLALLQAKAGLLKERYDRALLQAPNADHLRLESIYALASMGFQDDARHRVEALLNMGSRSAEAWYLGTSTATADERLKEADRRFGIAYELEPITRRQLFKNPLLSYIATRPESFSLFDFGSAQEPKVRPEVQVTQPLELPQESTARSLGGRLEVTHGGSRLTLPGAAALLPPETPVESAAEAETRETSEALDRLGELIEAAQRSGGLTHPARQRQAKVAAQALAEDRRWEELISLTDHRSGTTLDAELVKLRSLALLEMGRDVEGKNLLIELAQANLANRRRDPGTLYQLAEMFVRSDEYELALKLIRKANSLSPQKVSPQRIRQIEMDRDLEASFATFESPHFTLRYPRATGEKYPRELSWVLEAEWKRLQRWIPVPGRQKVEIHLFAVEDFMAAYSGGVAVLGIYDGKVRVPLADLKSFHPLLVNILSHEVAHAMIDLATEDRAPKWFHEGLASHIEMDQSGINPIPDMHRAGRDLSFAIIEPVLAGFSEPQLVGLAYSHATWALHYIEAKHGVRAIHRLLKSFRRGQRTEQALQSTLGLSVGEFDLAMRRWCLDDAPSIWPTQLVRYDQQFDTLIEREKPRGPAPTVALPALSQDPEAEMRTWHAGYAKAVAPVKGALGRTLAILRGKSSADLNTTCRQLATGVSHLTGGGKALEAPTESLRRNLKGAYRQMGTAARACLANDRRKMEDALQRATDHLGKAHRELSRYELQP